MVSETEDEVGGSEEKVNSRGEPEPMGPRLLEVRLRVGVRQVMSATVCASPAAMALTTPIPGGVVHCP